MPCCDGKSSAWYSIGNMPTLANAPMLSVIGTLNLPTMPSKLRSFEKTRYVLMNGLGMRPPMICAQSVGFHDNHAWPSQRSFLANPPQRVCVVETGLLSLP